MNLVKSAALLVSGLVLLAPLTLHARAQPPTTCKPCGSWELDVAASQPAEAAIETAMLKYKEPKMPRRRAPRGDLIAEAEAEFENSLDIRPGPARRANLREELLRLLQSPTTLNLRQDGDDIVIEAQDGPTRRVTPGEPHDRVDARGTAHIVSTWRKPAALTVAETYSRKTSNREIYALDARTGNLLVTRTVERVGLPDVVVHSSYRPR